MPSEYYKMVDCSKQYVAHLSCSYQAFFSHFVWVHLVQLHCSTDTATAWENSHFILSERSDFHMVDITFNRWDIATEVYELVYRFQKLVILWEDGTIFLKFKLQIPLEEYRIYFFYCYHAFIANITVRKWGPVMVASYFCIDSGL